MSSALFLINQPQYKIIRLLESFEIMDFSLLLGIHNLDKAERSQAAESDDGVGVGGDTGGGDGRATITRPRLDSCVEAKADYVEPVSVEKAAEKTEKGEGEERDRRPSIDVAPHHSPIRQNSITRSKQARYGTIVYGPTHMRAKDSHGCD